MSETWTHYANEGQIRDESDRLVAAEVWGDDARLIAEAPKMEAEAQALLDVIQNVMERGFVEVPGMEILREAMEPIEAVLARIRGEATNDVTVVGFIARDDWSPEDYRRAARGEATE